MDGFSNGWHFHKQGNIDVKVQSDFKGKMRVEVYK